MTPRRRWTCAFALAVSLAAPVDVLRAEDPVAAEGAAAAPKPSKKKAATKKKAYDYDRSKYKSFEPSQTPTYKFNEKGDAIRPQAKKKSGTKKSSRREPPEADGKEAADVCGPLSDCARKTTEADAL